MIATAIIVAVVFGIVFFVVQETVYQNLDSDLTYEAEKHTDEIKMLGDSIQFINKAEWAEIEHREIQVNPVFIQIFDKNGNLMDKSPNLNEDELPFRKQEQFGGYFNENLNKQAIRQILLSTHSEWSKHKKNVVFRIVILIPANAEHYKRQDSKFGD